MRPRLIGITAAVLIGAVGTMILLAYVRAAQAGATDAPTVPALVADQAVPAGTPTDELDGLVLQAHIPAATAPADRITDLADHAGAVTTVDLVPGEVLLASRVATAEELRAAGQVDVPADHQQVTLSLEPQRAVGGQLRAGDAVAVFVSLENTEDGNATHLTLHDVLVTAVQRDDTPPDATEDTGTGRPPANNLLVTLALRGDDAAKAVFGAEFGRVWLSATGADAAEVNSRIQTTETIYR